MIWGFNMKLIDLLVQELPERGGWDRQFDYGAQDADGCFCFFKSTPELGISGSLWVRGDSYIIGPFLKAASDFDVSIVTRAQYEAALAASQQPAWNGEGLPPVGTVCEWEDNDKWLKVEVVFSSRWVIVIRSKENNAGFGVDAAIDLVKDKFAYLSFRPIRTEAERRRDDLKSAIAELCRQSASNGHSADLIYDAIAAGKIPGVKLV